MQSGNPVIFLSMKCYYYNNADFLFYFFYLYDLFAMLVLGHFFNNYTWALSYKR